MINTYFAERREAVHVLHQHGGTEARAERYQGIGRTEYSGNGSRHHYDTVAPDDVRIDAATRSALDELLMPWPTAVSAETALTELAAGLAGAAGLAKGVELVVSLRSYEQDVLAGPAEALLADTRRFYTVNLEARDGRRADGRPDVHARRDSAVADLDDLPALAGELLRQLRTDLDVARDLPERSLPLAQRPVVLGPGTGGMFFHELCGHPLEADVIASGTSQLAALRGQRVGPEWLTVLDDPCSEEAVFGYRVDDEGTPAEAVALIRDGVVADPLHSRATAAAMGERPNGHGRRMSYLYPALPRQCHTRVLPGRHTDDEVLGTAGEAVLVHRFRVRYVFVDGGGFSFFAPSALLLEDGKPVARLRDVEITGDIVSTLGNIRAIGDRGVAWIGGGGCGKLNQGPLITGFEQPHVLVDGLSSASTHFTGENGDR
ncbi:TldD/PmbA family protein [Actinosynnema sp. NPDC059797]